MLNEAQRLNALHDYQVLDTPPEAAFDNITTVAAALFGAPIVLVSLIDQDRQWFKSRVGLDATETPRAIAFCDHAIREEEPLVVRDTTLDPRFASNPLVTGALGIRFYCGVPLRTPEGHGLGTLCLIDKVPREIDHEKLVALRSLAHQVEIELEIRRRLLILQRDLELQRQEGRSKELMASMLVHDLRAPLSAIVLMCAVLARRHPESDHEIQGMLDESERMRRMLIDVLDICLHELSSLRLRRTRLSLTALVLETGQRLSRLARQRGQQIVFDLDEDPLLVDADPELVERVLTNLATNAIQHGPEKSITLSARVISSDRIRVEVQDLGSTIPAASREAVFGMFEQLGKVDLTARGYGLGLAFCRLAIVAHGGSIGVVPNFPSGNTFYFELPRGSHEN